MEIVVVQERPTLLFIGRNGDADQAWLKIRRIWSPGRALRASQAYGGMALLLKHDRLRLVVVGVDELSQAEMSFFSAASRRYPKLKVLAFGKGDELSNRRLADATWHGAGEAVSTEQLPQRLKDLHRQQQAGPQPARTSRLIEKMPARTVEPPVGEASQGQADLGRGLEPEKQENLLARRSVAKNRRKAPPAKAPKSKQIKTEDIVTPEELRVLLGEEGEEPDK